MRLLLQFGKIFIAYLYKLVSHYRDNSINSLVGKVRAFEEAILEVIIEVIENNTVAIAGNTEWVKEPDNYILEEISLSK